MAKISKRLRATAYHEAGHAAVARYHRIPVYRASIVPDPDRLGFIRHPRYGIERFNHIDTDRQRLRAEKFVRMSLAGVIASKKVEPKTTRALLDGRGDYETATELIEAFCGSEEEVEAYLRLLQIQTAMILNLDFVWEEVETLADALLERSELSGREIAKLLG